MKSFRSAQIRRIVGALLFTLAAGCATAQDAPIRMLVGFAPSGMTDLVARLLAQGMQAELGRTVVVENRAGAGGQIAAQALKGAKPDGTTIYLTNSHTTAMIPLTTLNAGYDVAKDFVPVGLVATNPNFFIVNPAVVGPSVNSLKDFMQWAKANPTRGNIGAPAPASAPEFSVAVLSQTFGVNLAPVAYRGDAPLVQDLLGGQLPAGIAGIAAAVQHVHTGRLKLVAVDGPRRLEAFPDVPTYGELGIKGLQDVIFIGVIAPTGMPQALIDQYNAAINKTVRSKAFYARISELGIIPQSGSPEDMAHLTEASRLANIPLIKAAGYKPQ
jgi:tripartite-type tricarboxylate transporter receptor subunit TctC